MALKIGIVDDDINDVKALSQQLNRFLKEKELDFTITSFLTYDDFINSHGQFDILFLDIRLGNDNGMDLAEEIRKKNSTVFIIFETSNPNFAIEGYKVEAFDYLLKPVSYESLAITMSKIITLLSRKREHSIYIKNTDGIYMVKTSTLMFIEVNDHNLYFHLADKTIEGSFVGGLKGIYKQLASYGFVFASNQVLVNMSFIKSIQDANLILSDGKIIKVSRGCLKNLKDELAKWII